MRSGNPNTTRGVFITEPPNKRRRTEEKSPPINPGPLGHSKRSSVDRHIDLTKDEVELGSHSLTVSEESDDPLNLGAKPRPNPRVVNDGRATRRLRAGRRGGESSKAVDTDEEAEAIEEYPEGTKKRMVPKERGGKVQGIVKNIESRNGGESHTPRLPLVPSVQLLPPKPKVRLSFIEDGAGLDCI